MGPKARTRCKRLSGVDMVRPLRWRTGIVYQKRNPYGLRRNRGMHGYTVYASCGKNSGNWKKFWKLLPYVTPKTPTSQHQITVSSTIQRINKYEEILVIQFNKGNLKCNFQRLQCTENVWIPNWFDTSDLWRHLKFELENLEPNSNYSYK